jgi:hypothetical protein
MAREVTGLLRDTARRNAIRENAYKLGREMIWSNVARLYMRSFERARPAETVGPWESVAPISNMPFSRQASSKAIAPTTPLAP